MARFRWTAMHTKVLMMTVKGESNDFIKEKTGLNSSQLCHLRARPEFIGKQKAIERKAGETADKAIESYVQDTTRARQVINDSAYDAAIMVIKLAKRGKPQDRIKLDAAKDILDRAGMKPVEVIESRERQYSPEETASALKTVKELETVTERLRNQNSPYIVKGTERTISISVDSKAASPVTEERSDDQITETPEANP